METEFEASNGLTVRTQGDGILVDNQYIGAEHAKALHEYFQGVAVA